MKRFSNIIIYVCVALFSLTFFLYLSFPYNILKETIAIQMSNALGLSVSIKDLGPRLFVGLNAEGVQLGAANARNIEFKNISARLSLISLFLAKVRVNVEVNDSTGGNMDVDLSLGIFDLISGNVIPSSVSLVSEKFTFGPLVELGLKLQAGSPDTSPFIKPILEKISVTGKLNSQIDLSLNTSDFSRSTGTVNISLADASIDFDPAMQIPTQKFETAILRASSGGGNFSFDPSSRFKSKDLDIALTGKIIEKTKIEQSILDLMIKVQLSKELKNTFGVVLNAMAGKETDGKLDIKISGPVIPSPDIRIL